MQTQNMQKKAGIKQFAFDYRLGANLRYRNLCVIPPYTYAPCIPYHPLLTKPSIDALCLRNRLRKQFYDVCRS